jgi:Uncharacterised protein conserved in bacteria (DUF2313)
MAVFETGAISLSSVANTTAGVRLIASAKATPNSTASASGKIVAIVKAGLSVSSTASQSVNRTITRKYVSTSLATNGAVVGDSRKYKTVRAVLDGVSSVAAFYSDRDTYKELYDYLPRYYEEVRKVDVMVQTQSNEVTRLRELTTDLFRQFYVNTATYGLDRWETNSGLNESNRNYQERRDYVNSKLRGTGTVTKALIKAVVDAFFECEVTENNGEFIIAIKLVGKRGIPSNLADIERAINDIIPAHLGITFKFTWLPWSEVDESGLIWNEADTFTWDDLETAFLV